MLSSRNVILDLKNTNFYLVMHSREQNCTVRSPLPSRFLYLNCMTGAQEMKLPIHQYDQSANIFWKQKNCVLLNQEEYFVMCCWRVTLLLRVIGSQS